MYEHQFLKSLCLTIVIETPILFIIIRYFFALSRAAVSNRLILFSGVISSGFTLPYLWFVLPAFIGNHRLYVVVGELSVTLVEMIIFRFVLELNLRRCCILSVISNLCSYLFGAVLFGF